MRIRKKTSEFVNRVHNAGLKVTHISRSLGVSHQVLIYRMDNYLLDAAELSKVLNVFATMRANTIMIEEWLKTSQFRAI